jgi:O-acetyl-ADP-ribose deacetylase (regulator of RNase III)
MRQVLRAFTYPNGSRLQIVRGDLTQERVDAIVNAANDRLKHGGGIARLIAQRGGRVIQKESDTWVRDHGPVSHAQPAYTSAGKLPCRFVIHAVGPIWGAGDEDGKLAQAITGSLALADHLALGSIALPAISTGIFGFPKARAAGVFYQAILGYFADHPESNLAQVRLALYDQPTIDAFLEVWDAQTADST